MKASRLTLTNTSRRARTLSVYSYNEWSLGPPRMGHQRHVVTSRDAPTGALVARNPYNSGFADRVAFSWASEPVRSMTGDRTEFIGRNGTLARAAALTAAALSNRLGAGLDPCGALHVDLTLAPGETRQLVFLLGEGSSIDEVRALLARCGDLSRVEAARQEVDAQLGTHARRDSGAYAGRFVRPADERLVAASDAQLPLVGTNRLLPAGRCVRLPRPTAGCDGPRASRDPSCCASICCWRPAGSSSKGTSSTGGTLPTAAARARDARTTCSGCPTLWRTTSG